MLNVDHLTKRYGTVTAVDSLSFEVGPGRVTGFLGPNGAGKPDTELRHSFRLPAVWIICPEPDQVSEALDDRVHDSIICQGVPHFLT